MGHVRSVFSCRILAFACHHHAAEHHHTYVCIVVRTTIGYGTPTITENGTKRYTALFTVIVSQGPGIPLLKTLTAVTNVVFKARLEHESAADIHFGGSKHHPAYRRGSRSDVTRRHDQRCPHRQ